MEGDQLIEDQVLFPTRLIGRFIGTGGVTIKSLQGRHPNVSIRVAEQKDAKKDKTPVILKGKNRIDIESAKKEIQNNLVTFVEEDRSKPCIYGSNCTRRKCTFSHPTFKEDWTRASGTEKRRNKNKPSKDE